MSLTLSANFHRATYTERAVMRDELHTPMAALTVWPVDDEIWACEVAGVIFEAGSLGELFRYLADVVEES